MPPDAAVAEFEIINFGVSALPDDQVSDVKVLVIAVPIV